MSDSPLRIVPPKSTLPDPANPAAEADPQDAPQPAELTLGEMDELRRLLLEPEQLQLSNILERLNNPRVRAREMSRPLPEAIRLRNAQDDALSEALSPTIVQAFHSSIKKDPRPVAEAISPLMGPAIRRAISVALSAMVQSFDQVLKHSLSRQGLKWRIEAIRTGKSFAEVVLLHTLIYRVEQVFLIHKQTGLLLQHLAADATITHDADIVSGMLTAIQVAIGNFARDSFGSDGPSEAEQIDTLDLGGDREIWFESGHQAVLAVAIKGRAPETLRSDYFAPALEAIQVEMQQELHTFDGDAALFENSRRYLEDCLQSQYEGRTDPADFKIPAYVWWLLAAIVIALGLWGFYAIRSNWRWTNYLERLKTEPGIVITETGKHDGKRFLAGLRDPLAADPDAILRNETALDPSGVVARWEPYQALGARFVLARARQILDPPATVELKLDQGVLSASGIAPHDWIVEARRIARALPGITDFDDQKLSDQDLKEPEALRQRIQQVVIRFITGSAQIAPGQDQTMRAVRADIQNLLAMAPAAGRRVRLELIGHTDTEGDELANQRLSQQRAEKLLSMLFPKHTTPDSLIASVIANGVGSTQPVHAETSETDKQFNRSVSFKVSLLDPRSSTRPQPQQERR